MNVHPLFARECIEPPRLRALGSAFDQAEQILGRGHTLSGVEREALAAILLALAWKDENDVGEITVTAVAMFGQSALKYG